MLADTHRMTMLIAFLEMILDNENTDSLLLLYPALLGKVNGIYSNNLTVSSRIKCA